MTPNELDKLCTLIAHHHRERQRFLRAERSLVLQMKAFLRRVASLSCPDHKRICKRCRDMATELYDGKGEPAAVAAAQEANAPLLIAIEPVHAAKMAAEREMVSLAKQLPVYAFVDETRGFGALALAQIVGEAGNLSQYTNPGKLWKRFGLAVIDGSAQRRVKDAEQAERHGFSPPRRAVMFTTGDALVKQGAEYRELYLERKAYERERHECTDKERCGWCHKRAQRYMEKRLLRDLWRAWRDERGQATSPATPNQDTPAPGTQQEEAS